MTPVRLTLLSGALLGVSCLAAQPNPEPATSTGTPGYYRVARLNDRWWFIDPAGRPTWLCGVNWSHRGWLWQVDGQERWPHLEAMRARHGTDAAVVDADLAKLKQWGFNAVVMGRWGTQEHIREFISMRDHVRQVKTLPYMWLANYGYYYFDPNDEERMIRWTGYSSLVNPFSPGFAPHVERMVAEDAAVFSEAPALIGYLLDNEMEWCPGPQLVDAVMGKSPQHTAKQELVRYLEEQCKTIGELNQVAGTRLASFAAVADAKALPLFGPRGEALADGFLRHTVAAYFRIVTAAIRKHDPSHLILGARDKCYLRSVVEAGGPFVDVWTVNYYSNADPTRGVPRATVDLIRDQQRWSGKPVMVTEWSFCALDSGLANTTGAGIVYMNQQQRAACFRAMQETLASLPDVVGSWWFQWADPPIVSEGITFEDKNYGLVKSGGEPWPELTGMATEVNAKTMALHGAGRLERVAATPTPGERWNAPLPDLPTTGPWSVPGLELRAGSGGVEVLREGRVWARITPQIRRNSGGGLDWPVAAPARLDRLRRDDDFLAGDVTFEGAEFASGWRLWLRRGAPAWWAMECLWVENRREVAWRLEQVFHAVFPPPGATQVGTHAFGWQDRQARVGTLMLSPDRRVCVMPWGRGSDLHADNAQEAGVDLVPGERWQAERTATVNALYDPNDIPAAEALRQAVEAQATQWFSREPGG